MNITLIKVRAGRCFNHPYEEYSNLQPSVVMTATITEGENPVEATKALQAQAEQLVEDHKQGLLKSLRELHQLSERKQQLIRLQQQVAETQQEMEKIRFEYPELSNPASLSRNTELPF